MSRNLKLKKSWHVKKGDKIKFFNTGNPSSLLEVTDVEKKEVEGVKQYTIKTASETKVLTSKDNVWIEK